MSGLSFLCMLGTCLTLTTLSLTPDTISSFPSIVQSQPNSYDHCFCTKVNQWLLTGKFFVFSDFGFRVFSNFPLVFFFLIISSILEWKKQNFSVPCSLSTQLWKQNTGNPSPFSRSSIPCFKASFKRQTGRACRAERKCSEGHLLGAQLSWFKSRRMGLEPGTGWEWGWRYDTHAPQPTLCARWQETEASWNDGPCNYGKEAVENEVWIPV